MDPVNVLAKFSVGLGPDNSNWGFGWGCEPVGEEEAVGGRGLYVYRSKEHVGEFLYYRPSTTNFSSIFTRFRDIAAFVLQHATFPIPSLVSPEFSHVPLELGGWPLG